MEFCQWLMTEKGVEAGNLSSYINDNEEEVLKLAKEFKAEKFKVGGKINLAAEKFKCGGKAEKNKVKKAKDGMKSNPKKEQYKTAIDSNGNKVELTVAPSMKYPNQMDSMIYTRAPQGGSYSLFKRANQPITGNHQGEMFPYTELDSKKAAELFRQNANLFNKPVKAMAGGGETVPQEPINRQQFKRTLKVTKPVPGGGEATLYPGLQDSTFEFMPNPGQRIIVNTTDSVGTGTDIYGNVNKISADSTSKLLTMFRNLFNKPVDNNSGK